MDILVHVSPAKIEDRLMPSDKDHRARGNPLIFFSVNEFMSRYGEWVYLFDRQVLIDKYQARLYDPSVRHFRGVALDNRSVLHQRERNGFEEWVVPVPVDISDAIGVIHHRDLSVNAFDREIILNPMMGI